MGVRRDSAYWHCYRSATAPDSRRLADGIATAGTAAEGGGPRRANDEVTTRSVVGAVPPQPIIM